jgi:hypothetical protein
LRVFAIFWICLVTATLSAQEGYYSNSTHNFNKFWKSLAPGNKDSAVCTYEFNWTAYRGTHPIVKIVNSEIARLACNSWNDSCPGDSLTEKWIEQQSEYFRSEWMAERNSSNPWIDHSFFTLISVADNGIFLSISKNTDTYTGGAKPYIRSEFSVIDKSNSSRVASWQSLFKDTLSLLKIAEAQFRMEYEILDSIPTNRDWFFGKEFYLPQQFYFDQNGLNFSYDSGEIVPPSMGYPVFQLPYEKIEILAKKPLR